MSLLRKPLPLRPDTKIAVIAPSNWVEPDVLNRAIDNARTTYGLHIELHPQCTLREGNSGGSTIDKLEAFHDVWEDPSIGAVFAARGGSRALHMLDGLDWINIAKYPKILLGFSDTVALLNNIYRKTSIPTFHGLHFQQFDPDKAQDLIMPTLALLTGETWGKPLFPVTHPYQILQEGDVTGPLIGGNIASVYALAASGVDYAPRWAHKILMLEDIDEDLRVLDRMFGALRLAGVFREIKGLVCGQFTGITDTSNYPFDRTPTDIITEHVLPGFDGPIVLNAPFGHVAQNYPFPIGVMTQLIAESGQMSLQLMESPFAE